MTGRYEANSLSPAPGSPGGARFQRAHVFAIHRARKMHALPGSALTWLYCPALSRLSLSKNQTPSNQQRQDTQDQPHIKGFWTIAKFHLVPSHRDLYRAKRIIPPEDLRFPPIHICLPSRIVTVQKDQKTVHPCIDSTHNTAITVFHHLDYPGPHFATFLRIPRILQDHRRLGRKLRLHEPP